MTSILVLYGTSEGQTATITERMAAVIEAIGHDVALINATHRPTGFALEDYDAAVLASSIHMGSHQESIAAFVDEHLDALNAMPTAFVDEHLDALNAMPTAFVSVSLSAAGDEEGQAAAEAMIHEFLDETGYDPDRTLSVAGALKYSEYGFIKRFMMKRIAREEGGDTDPSRDYEYTDWDSVEAFAAEFASSLT